MMIYGQDQGKGSLLEDILQVVLKDG